MNTCYIFGASEGVPESFKRRNEDLIIAADAGIDHVKRLGISPDIALGDFDSLGYIPECEEIIRHPVKKDDTDTMLAVKTAFERGYKRIVLYGCAGGRPDHTFANYQTLAYISSRGGEGYLLQGEYAVTAVTNGKISFKSEASGTLSVFSAVTKSKGVYLKNLLYNLENATVDFDFPIGISNEFIGKPAEICVSNGTLIVFWEGTFDDVDGFCI